MVSDFHTHTFLSDGSLSPVELTRRAIVSGYRTLAITDHVSMGNLEFVVRALVTDCEYLRQAWDITVLPGVEITHVPARFIDETARRAKELGAQLVVVHGETLVEPVEAGTNLAALRSPYVDILAHPGLLTEEEARVAAERGVFLELSAKRGHSLTNGHVARLALEAGAPLILDSDAHHPEDLLTPELVQGIALGSGLRREHLPLVVEEGPARLLHRLKEWSKR